MARTVVEYFQTNTTWTAPAGVSRIRVVAERNFQALGYGGHAINNSLTALTGANALNTYVWGENGLGSIADGSSVGKSSPVLVSGTPGYVKMQHGNGNFEVGSIFLDQAGSVFTAGASAKGGLGDGTNTAKSVPTAIAGNRRFKDIARGGDSAYAVEANGTGYAWGDGSSGQLGDGTVVAKSSPVLIAGSFNFLSIAAGRFHAGGLIVVGTTGLNSREIYMWGLNDKGQLGLNDTTTRSSPIFLSNATSHRWKSFTAGDSFTAVLNENLDTYCMGLNDKGQLGDGTTVSKSTPTLVVGSHKFNKVIALGASCVGIKQNGDVYAWGDNTKGQLGQGDTTARSSPVLVTGGLKFAEIGGSAFTATAVAVDGQIYAWGDSANGQLGDGTIVAKSTPTLVVGGLRVNPSHFNPKITDIEVIPGTSYNATFYNFCATFAGVNVGSLVYNFYITYEL